MKLHSEMIFAWIVRRNRMSVWMMDLHFTIEIQRMDVMIEIKKIETVLSSKQWNILPLRTFKQIGQTTFTKIATFLHPFSIATTRVTSRGSLPKRSTIFQAIVRQRTSLVHKAEAQTQYHLWSLPSWVSTTFVWELVELFFSGYFLKARKILSKYFENAHKLELEWKVGMVPSWTDWSLRMRAHQWCWTNV